MKTAAQAKEASLINLKTQTKFQMMAIEKAINDACEKGESEIAFNNLTSENYQELITLGYQITTQVTGFLLTTSTISWKL